MVVREVCSIFSTGVMPSHLNQTLVTLIPKCIGANYLSLYKPISLCIIIYKIITKIIVQRLRPFLDKLVSPLQATFVPRRKGLDNMIIVQELIHTMSTKKGNQGYMAINWSWKCVRQTWVALYLRCSHSLQSSSGHY